MDKTIVMPDSKEARDTEAALKKLPAGAVPLTAALIGSKGGPPKPKYVEAIRVQDDGTMLVEMVGGKTYCVSDLIKANAGFHHNEGVMLTKIKQLMEDKKTALHNQALSEIETEDLKRKLKTLKRRISGKAK